MPSVGKQYLPNYHFLLWKIGLSFSFTPKCSERTGLERRMNQQIKHIKQREAFTARAILGIWLFSFVRIIHHLLFLSFFLSFFGAEHFVKWHFGKLLASNVIRKRLL